MLWSAENRVRDSGPAEAGILGAHPRTLTAAEQSLIAERLQVLSVVAKQVADDPDIGVRLGNSGETLRWNDREICVPPEFALSPRWEDVRFGFALQGARRRIGAHDVREESTSPALTESEQEGFKLLEAAVDLGRAAKFARQAYPYLDARSPSRLFSDLKQALVPGSERELGTAPESAAALFSLLEQTFPAQSPAVQAPTVQSPADRPAALDGGTRPQLPAEALLAAREAINCYPTRKELENPGIAKAYGDHSRRLLREKVWPHFRELVVRDVEKGTISRLLRRLQSSDRDRNALTQTLTKEGRKQLEQALEELERQQQPGSASRSRTKGSAGAPQQSGGGSSAGECAAAAPQRGNDDSSAAKQHPRPPSERSSTAGREEKGRRGNPRDAQDSVPTQSQIRRNAPREGTDRGQAGAGRQKGTEAEKPQVSPELVRDLKNYLASLPDGEREQLNKQCIENLKLFREGLEKAAQSAPPRADAAHSPASGNPHSHLLSSFDEKAAGLLAPSRTAYDVMVDGNLSLIGGLEGSLKSELRRRRASGWETGYRAGAGPVHLRTRISEVARTVPPFASLAFQQLTNEQALDYALFLLVDLSPSMKERITHAFRGTVVVVEGCSRAAIPIGVSGFSNTLYDAKGVDDPLTPEVKARLGGFAQNLGSSTDMGWAMDEASKRLAEALQKNKVLIVLTDGVPEPSGDHAGPEYSISAVLNRIHERSGQTVIVLGLLVPQATLQSYLGPDIPAIGDVTPDGLPGVLAKAIEDVIVRKRYPKKTKRSSL